MKSEPLVMPPEVNEPTPSHLHILSEVYQHAEAIRRLTVVIPRECNPEGKLYVTVAYRFGNTNGHWYFVYAGTDQDHATAEADDEVQERGGKYGCAVYEFVNNSDYLLVYYKPSMMEDAETKEPKHNYRREYFEQLGMCLDEACEGTCWQVDPVVEGSMVQVKIPAPVPDFLKVARERQQEHLRRMTQIEQTQKQTAAS